MNNSELYLAQKFVYRGPRLLKSLFNEKIQITKFLPKKFCGDFQQISMSLVKIGQKK